MSPELLYLLRRRIRAAGPIRFDEFMDLVLYSDPHGYYRNNVPGGDSDYQTSPTLTPWFGLLVAQQLRAIWEGLGSPAEFTVVEVGGGNADLAAAVIDAAEGGFGEAVRWVYVEPLDSVAAMQRARFGSSDRFSWAGDLADLPPVTGVILANEVLDNFPFRIFEVTEDGPVEIRVGFTRHHLDEVRFPVGPEIARTLAPALEHLDPGDRLELRSGVGEWMVKAARLLEKGRLILVDYGDLEPETWTRHPSGSMVTYRQGELGKDPFEEVGGSDITAHVNFSEVARAAADAGLEPLALQTQKGWLESLGLNELVADFRRRETEAQAGGRYPEYLRIMAQRSKIELLAARGGLGDYLVFSAQA